MAVVAAERGDDSDVEDIDGAFGGADDDGLFGGNEDY
jgi:hypothetical protein